MAKGTRSPLFYEWLKNPNSWLSLSAAVISIVSFVLVYTFKGTIAVLLPYEAGIGISRGSNSFAILLPATFSNTGASRTRRDIRHVTARVHSLDKSVPLEGTADWVREKRFVGGDEYLANHLEEKDEGTEDYVVYVNRPMPFSLAGGQSVTKVLELELAGVHPPVCPSEFQIELILHTEGCANFKASSIFKCPKGDLTLAKATWCRAAIDGQ